MKFLTLLLIVYVFALPCIPCNDTEECKNETRLQFSTASNNHQDHAHKNESCSPFCNCTCCGQIVAPNFQLLRIAVAAPPAEQGPQYFTGNFSFTSSFPANIWQPPRFS